MSRAVSSAFEGCPTCGGPVDALRSKYVRVMGARVAAFCSAECLGGVARAALPSVMPVAAVVASTSPSTSTSPSPSTKPVSNDILPVIADHLAAPSAVGPRTRPWRRALWLVAGAGVVSMGVAAWSSMRTTRPTEAGAAEPGNARAAPPQQDIIAPPSPLARAREVLREAQGSRSTVVRLRAAALLAGEGDVPALEILAAITEQGLPLEKLEAAEALAAAGDARGLPLLIATLDSPRRDLRLEAARTLSRLGNPAGARLLSESLGDRERGLSSAEALADLGDKRGVAALEAALASPLPEQRMRAALGLGRTGHARGEPVLRQILADGRYQNGAATALARLGAADVEPKLLEALRFSSLRVEAARALQKLGRRLDTAALAALEADLDLGADPLAQLSAAEALLVLAAPAPPPTPKLPADAQGAR